VRFGGGLKSICSKFNGKAARCVPKGGTQRPLHNPFWLDEEFVLEIMARNFLGTPLRRWIEYLAAILLGNAIYYFSLVPHLPPVLRHQGFLLDWGSLVDFIVCLGVYGLIRVGSKMRLSRSG
jgi:hypothetical protein